MRLPSKVQSEELTGCDFAADALWGALKQSNSDLAETFATLTRLAKEDREAYVREVDPLALKTGDEVRTLPASPIPSLTLLDDSSPRANTPSPPHENTSSYALRLLLFARN